MFFHPHISIFLCVSLIIENLTKSMAQHAWNLFLQIEDLGGFRTVMENSWIKNEIEKSADNKLNALLKRKSNIIGINNYPNLNETISPNLTKPLINKPKMIMLLEFSELQNHLKIYVILQSNIH